MQLTIVPMYQIVALWKAGAQAPNGLARNTLYWECVYALEARGFAGSARRILERAAAW